MDYQDIESLFNKDQVLPKYKHKRWVKIQDTNNGNYNSPVKYYCKTVADKLVDYSQGYILLDGSSY
jgi:predicted transglutaminase-like protease